MNTQIGSCSRYHRYLFFIIVHGNGVGLIQKSVSEEESERTPLKVKLDEFGDKLAKVIGVRSPLPFSLAFLAR